MVRKNQENTSIHGYVRANSHVPEPPFGFCNDQNLVIYAMFEVTSTEMLLLNPTFVFACKYMLLMVMVMHFSF
jgi:hypothetical protein